MEIEPFRKHLEQLKNAYVDASPALRAENAIQRMISPEGSANRLITAVSATEALARALLLQNLEERSLFRHLNGQRKRSCMER